MQHCALFFGGVDVNLYGGRAMNLHRRAKPTYHAKEEENLQWPTMPDNHGGGGRQLTSMCPGKEAVPLGRAFGPCL